MSQMLTGSVCLTDMIEKAKAGHSAFSKGNNGKIYTNILVWLNDEPDQYDNHASIQLNSKKEKKEAEGKVYIGNMKKLSGGGGESVTTTDAASLELGDLPF